MDENIQSNNAGSPPMSAPAPDTDISKTTVTILVLLTLMISVIGTWTVLNELSNARVSSGGHVSSPGKVELTITGPPGAPKTTQVTGNVALRVN